MKFHVKYLPTLNFYEYNIFISQHHLHLLKSSTKPTILTLFMIDSIYLLLNVWLKLNKGSRWRLELVVVENFEAWGF
jgi:hypothetical protein